MAADTFHSSTFLSGKRKLTIKVPALKHLYVTQYLKPLYKRLLALMNGLPLSFLTQSSHIVTIMSISLHLTSPIFYQLYKLLEFSEPLILYGLCVCLAGKGFAVAQDGREGVGWCSNSSSSSNSSNSL